MRKQKDRTALHMWLGDPLGDKHRLGVSPHLHVLWGCRGNWRSYRGPPASELSGAVWSGTVSLCWPPVPQIDHAHHHLWSWISFHRDSEMSSTFLSLHTKTQILLALGSSGSKDLHCLLSETLCKRTDIHSNSPQGRICTLCGVSNGAVLAITGSHFPFVPSGSLVRHGRSEPWTQISYPAASPPLLTSWRSLLIAIVFLFVTKGIF